MNSDVSSNHHQLTASIFPNTDFTALCFDRSEFNRADFDVDAFLAKARRRGASLEQIRDDARVYLKIIQNSMIELINQDYADFVHLSSNLAGLRGAVEKLGAEADEMTMEFERTAEKIEEAVRELSNETVEKRRLLNDQRYLEKKIMAATTLERLKRFLTTDDFLTFDNDDDVDDNVSTTTTATGKDFETIQRVSYLIDELRSINNSTSTKSEFHPNFDRALSSILDHFQKWLESKLVRSVRDSDRLLLVFVLRGFESCNRSDSAQAAFLAQFVEPELRSCFVVAKKQQQKSTTTSATMNKLEQFKNLLDRIVVLKNRYRPIFAAESTAGIISEYKSDVDESTWKSTAAFLDDCLLTALLSSLQDRFSSILIPTEADTFLKAYRYLMAFSDEWTTTSNGGGGNKIMKMVFEKFSLLIYYQLCYHEITSSIDAGLNSADDELQQQQSSINGKYEPFSLQSTSIVYSKMQSIWSSSTSSNADEDGVFLPPLMPKFWELTCMIINRYGRHVFDYVENFRKPPPSTAESVVENLSVTNGVIGGENSSSSTTPKRAATPIAGAAAQLQQQSFELMIQYTGDLRIFERRVIDQLFPSILSQSKIDIDDETIAAHLRRNLIDTFASMRQQIDGSISEALVPWLTSRVSGQLAAVVEVPRQYRWTRKEAPTQPSPYVAAALDPVQRLLRIANDKLSDDDPRLIVDILERVLANVIGSYTENLRGVFDSVEKISSSLNRLKTTRGTASIPENMSAVTDEQKIRLQLRLDVEELEKLILQLQPPVKCDLNEIKLLVCGN